jgi:DGQHR domain-containing protein
MLTEDPRSISIPVISVTQPIGTFYIGRMTATDLGNICRFDIRRILREREIETYLGIQRPLSPKRVAEIKQYVNLIDATFPTAVILAVSEFCASYTPLRCPDHPDHVFENFGMLKLSNFLDAENDEDKIFFHDIARVIDGQHRIAGLEEFQGSAFEINVTIFVGADIADQANIFSTVNLAQTKVNRSLVYDLFELSRVRSPEKTCHEIVVALDRNEKSPFYRRIKRLGVATEGRFDETLSQATFVRMLLPYISDNPALDRDTAKRGKRPQAVDASASQRLIFRNLFVHEKDLTIADILWNYFDAVRERWPEAWGATGRGLMLNRTNGFRALMRFLRPAYLYFTSPGGTVRTEQFSGLFKMVQLSDQEFTVEIFRPGTGGETALFGRLMADTEMDRNVRG